MFFTLEEKKLFQELLPLLASHSGTLIIETENEHVIVESGSKPIQWQ